MRSKSFTPALRNVKDQNKLLPFLRRCQIRVHRSVDSSDGADRSEATVARAMGPRSAKGCYAIPVVITARNKKSERMLNRLPFCVVRGDDSFTPEMKTPLQLLSEHLHEWIIPQCFRRYPLRHSWVIASPLHMPARERAVTCLASLSGRAMRQLRAVVVEMFLI